MDFCSTARSIQNLISLQKLIKILSIIPPLVAAPKIVQIVCHVDMSVLKSVTTLIHTMRNIDVKSHAPGNVQRATLVLFFVIKYANARLRT